MAKGYVLDGAWHELPEGASLPEGARETRRPETGERFDDDSGEWVLDPVLLADMEADPIAVAEAHLKKSIEASLILSGIPLSHGLLFDEAKATGVDLVELAERAAAKAAPADAKEVARRVSKTGG